MPLAYMRFVIGIVILFEVILFTERFFCSLDIHRVNFFAVKQLAICKQRYSNNAKFMLVMKELYLHVMQEMKSSRFRANYLA